MNIQTFHKVCLSTLLMQTVCVYSAQPSRLPMLEDLKYTATHYAEHYSSAPEAFKISLHVVLTNKRFEATRENLSSQKAPWLHLLQFNNAQLNNKAMQQSDLTRTLINSRFIVAYYAAAYEHIKDKDAAEFWKNVLLGKALVSKADKTKPCELKPDEPEPIRARL
jgi:hypothetical protein